jgi:hypothetical protein
LGLVPLNPTFHSATDSGLYNKQTVNNLHKRLMMGTQRAVVIDKFADGMVNDIFYSDDNSYRRKYPNWIDRIREPLPFQRYFTLDMWKAYFIHEFGTASYILQKIQLFTTTMLCIGFWYKFIKFLIIFIAYRYTYQKYATAEQQMHPCCTTILGQIASVCCGLHAIISSIQFIDSFISKYDATITEFNLQQNRKRNRQHPHLFRNESIYGTEDTSVTLSWHEKKKLIQQGKESSTPVELSPIYTHRQRHSEPDLPRYSSILQPRPSLDKHYPLDDLHLLRESLNNTHPLSTSTPLFNTLDNRGQTMGLTTIPSESTLSRITNTSVPNPVDTTLVTTSTSSGTGINTRPLPNPPNKGQPTSYTKNKSTIPRTTHLSTLNVSRIQNDENYEELTSVTTMNNNNA